MDYGFKDRVDKVFGSISSSSSSWSVTDAPVERREWNRDNRDRDDDQIPVFSNHQTDWDIRSSIGLDSTLDNEEEEDAYDKMAQGRENCDNRLYMKAVTDHGPYLNSHNLLPKSIHDASDEPMLDDGILRIKSILKRKACDELLAKPAKRVRFDSTCKDVDAPHPKASQHRPSVPDYILNPSKYTRYTFDDSSHDGSSSESYLEKIKNSSKHGGVEHKSCAELPKSVVFILRTKRGDAGCNSEKQSSCSTIGIAAVEVQHDEISEMQEDDDACTKARCQRPVRQYRSKMDQHDDVS